MPGVLQALKDYGFDCHHPSVADEQIGDGTDDEDRRPVYRPFEEPQPRSEQLEVQEPHAGAPSLFRYFLDGSMRTTSAGYITDNKNRFLPIYIAQIGVAVTELRRSRIALNSHKGRYVLFFPESFSQTDTDRARSIIRDTARDSNFPIEIDLECYELEENTPPIDSARKRILSTMHEMEINRIKILADSGNITRDALLMIDGSLQFYEHIDRNIEAFRNVVAVAKSFNKNQIIGSGNKSMEVGALIVKLRPRHRTPARKVEHRNRSIGSWYLRLHDTKPHSYMAKTDGVVKLEIFPDDPASQRPRLNANRCDRISSSVLQLRNPTTPSTDTRWASHLYPIHLTERYIKTQFRSDYAIRAYL